MSSNRYQIYVNACIDLATSIIIKSTYSVDGLNNYVNDQSLLNGTEPTNKLDPTTWKYYLNVSGQYHPIDNKIIITSLDTLQPIEFNVANLAIHKTTAIAYQYGSRYYNILVSQYPEQLLLINGILYPVDIDVAINATDGQILNYPSYLVEENEYSLISNLQTWINKFKIRWDNVQYGITDVLYPATILGIMYLNLLPAILTYRLEACKTNEAHSFHIRQYLASHNLLNDYIDNMTLGQMLFFYRNIAYIERNSGKQTIFDWLVYNVLTVRNLPLLEYLMKHDLSNQPTNLYPDIVFNRNSVNKQYSTVASTNLTLNDVLINENPLAPDNITYISDYSITDKELMENSLSNVIRTKILECSVIDDTGSNPYSLTDILFNEWIHLSSNGNYTAFINVINPQNNATLSLSVKDSYTLAFYLFCKSIDINLDTIPLIYANRVQRIMSPTVNGSTIAPVSDITSVIDITLVDSATVTLALSMQPEITNVITTNAFYQLCINIFNASQMQRKLISSQEYSLQRAMVLNMVSRIYSDNLCRFEPDNTTYASWLAENNIDVSLLNTIELTEFYTQIVSIATGANLYQTTSLLNIQSSMLKLLKQLTSYNIQFIQTINSVADNKTDWTAVRVASTSGSSNSIIQINDLSANLLDIQVGYNNVWYNEYPVEFKPFQMTSKSQITINNMFNNSILNMLSNSVSEIKVPIHPNVNMKLTTVTGNSDIGLIDMYGYNNTKLNNNVESFVTLVNADVTKLYGLNIVQETNTGNNISIGGFDTGLGPKLN